MRPAVPSTRPPTAETEDLIVGNPKKAGSWRTTGPRRDGRSRGRPAVRDRRPRATVGHLVVATATGRSTLC